MSNLRLPSLMLALSFLPQNYIHLEGVCHRDLKPENLLLDAAGTLKISDFGLCSVYKLKESGRTRMLSERCGSLPYVAPEVNSLTRYRPSSLLGLMLSFAMTCSSMVINRTLQSPLMYGALVLSCLLYSPGVGQFVCFAGVPTNLFVS